MGSLFNQEKREVSEERRNKTYNEHISGISKAAVLCNSSMYGDGCRISAEPCTVRKCATVSRNRCSLCGDPGYTGFSVLPGGAVSGLCSADVFCYKDAAAPGRLVRISGFIRECWYLTIILIMVTDTGEITSKEKSIRTS